MLEHRGFRVVLDLGYGTLPRLLTLLDSPVGDGVDAVVITHHHPDHMLDLHGLLRARWFGRRGAPPIPLFAPDPVLAVLHSLEDSDDAIPATFDFHALPAGPHRIGPFELTSVALPHFVPNAGVRLTAPELVVAYTGDTGPSPVLDDLARDADLFVAEASDRDQQPGTPPAPQQQVLHLNSDEAGAIAARAGARRLLLTHFWPGNNRELSRASAARHFHGEILLADEGVEIALP